MIIAEEPHLPVIEARELLTRIENGDPLIYDHVAIIGNIDIARLDLPLIHYDRPAKEMQTAVVVASKIQIRNCEFHGNVNFAHALLSDDLDLCGCTFLQEARFKGASFSGAAGFESCRFKRYATFRDANFQGSTRFQGTHFFAIANFGNAIFECPALFGSAHFSELCTNFGEASFLDEADFTQAKFAGTANFRLTSFGRSASFWKAGFHADANFQGAKFIGYASFQSAELSGNADFRGANFNEELNMEFASIQGNAIFLGSYMAKEANFFRANLLNINLRMQFYAVMFNFRRPIWAELFSQGLISRERHPSRDLVFMRIRFSIVRSSRDMPYSFNANFRPKLSLSRRSLLEKHNSRRSLS